MSDLELHKLEALMTDCNKTHEESRVKQDEAHLRKDCQQLRKPCGTFHACLNIFDICQPLT